MLLTPTTPMVAPKWTDAEDLQKATHSILRNCVGLGYAGLPSLNVPVGLDSQGVPVGMQLTAKWFNEPLLFRAGVAYQGAHRISQVEAKDFGLDRRLRIQSAPRPIALFASFRSKADFATDCLVRSERELSCENPQPSLRVSPFWRRDVAEYGL